MTAPAEQQVAPVDLGNSLLADHGALLSCTVVSTTAGQRLALTVRTPSTTLTVFLSKDDGENWAQTIEQKAREVSGLIVPGVAQLA